MTTDNASLMSDYAGHKRAVEYLSLIGHYLSHSFYRVSAKRAGVLCKPWGLPKHGYERLVTHNGIRYYIARTPDQGKQVWSARYAGVDPLKVSR